MRHGTKWVIDSRYLYPAILPQEEKQIDSR